MSPRVWQSVVALTIASCAPRTSPSTTSSYYGAPVLDDAEACRHAHMLLRAFGVTKGYKVGPPDPDCVPALQRITALDPKARECRVICMTYSETIASMHDCMRASCPKLPRAVLRRPENEIDPGPPAGGLNRPDDVIARNRWRFRECYGDALEIDRGASGKFQIAVTVSSTGAIEATVAEAEGPPALAECVRRSFTYMRFDPSTDDASSHFKIPVILSTASSKAK